MLMLLCELSKILGGVCIDKGALSQGTTTSGPSISCWVCSGKARALRPVCWRRSAQTLQRSGRRYMEFWACRCAALHVCGKESLACAPDRAYILAHQLMSSGFLLVAQDGEMEVSSARFACPSRWFLLHSFCNHLKEAPGAVIGKRSAHTQTMMLMQAHGNGFGAR